MPRSACAISIWAILNGIADRTNGRPLPATSRCPVGHLFSALFNSLLDRTSMLSLMPELTGFVQSEWEFHLRDRLSTLWEPPSGPLRAMCDVFLTDPEKYDLAFLMKYAKRTLSEEERENLWRLYESQKCKHMGYQPLSWYKLALEYRLKTTTSDLDRAETEARLNRYAGVDTPKATEIRKVLNPLLKKELGSQPKSTGGGEWRMPVSIHGVELALFFDFGRFARGFDYGILFPLANTRGVRPVLSYERLLGFRSTDWDLVRTDVLESQLVSLLWRIKQVFKVLEEVDVIKKLSTDAL